MALAAQIDRPTKCTESQLPVVADMADIHHTRTRRRTARWLTSGSACQSDKIWDKGAIPGELQRPAASAGSGRNSLPLQQLRNDSVQHAISEGF